LGAHPAPWRKELTLRNKTRLVNRLRHHVVVELRLSKLYFISDHELVIGFLDYTIDSSGLFTLTVLYNYHSMYWFLVVLFEISLYPVIGAISKQYTRWPSRNFVIMAVNIFFGLLTYLCGPYTEDIDRWFEFTGRILITLVAGGLVEYASINEQVISSTATPLFKPWEAIQYVYTIMKDGTLFTLPVMLDIFMTGYFFCYFLYILYSIGVFGVLQRMWKAIQFSYHDHILDFLVEKSEDKTFGVENTYTGLTLLQQWDDIIKSQRRYALIPWPDVRPPHLIPFSAKAVEVKWASYFNLTLKNIRSSLGLTILHATMFSADGEVCRWIMYANPELVQVMDSQNDTPVTIALKECAYYLLCYGDQNGGQLDDGTSYTDDDYSTYYPEVDDIRDEIYNHGEFISEISIEYYLTADDLRTILKEGKYLEPQKPNYGSVYDDSGIPIKLDLPPNGVLPNQVKSKGQALITWEEREEKRVLDQAKKKERILQAKQKKERQSLAQKRFPEDSLFRNYESGQSTSWAVIGYEIPNENIFLDTHICKRIQKYPHFHYSVSYGARKDNLHEDETKNVEEGKDANPNNVGLETIAESSNAAQQPSDESTNDMTSHKLSSKVDFDLQYIVPTLKKAHLLGEEVMIVPMDHPHLKDFPDFDRSKNKRKLSFVSNASSRSDTGGDKERRKSIVSNHSNFSDSTIFGNLLKKRTMESDRDVRFKVCKFAEILLSKELADSCKSFKWGIADFKAFNKLSSMNQGKIAQQLALVCHLNPPDGFVRISDWSRTYNMNAFDEKPEEDLPMLVKGIVAVVQKVEQIITSANDAMSNIVELQRLMRPSSSRTSSKLRGRKKRERATKSLAQIQLEKQQGQHTESDESGILCDRIIQFLAEALVCSTPYLVLDDCELSYNARRGWRAIARALRQKYCSFIVPSVFVPPYPVSLISLELPRNELDCGDCVYIADILFNQLSLRYLDLSFNRIGGRGLSRICKALREHREILVCKFNNNIVGPGAGQDIGILLKQTKCLKILDLHDNHLGEIIRYPTMYSREKIPSAAKFICLGLRQNKSLEILDLSYNHLGETLGLYLPLAVNKHPSIHTINISGNDLGPVHGCNLLFSLAGAPLGAQYAKTKEEFIRVIKNRQTAALKEKQKLLNGEEMEEKPPEEVLQHSQATNSEAKLGDLANHSLFAGDDGENELQGNNEDRSINSSHSNVMKNVTVQKRKPGGLIESLGKSFKDQLSKLSQPAMNLTSLYIADNQLGPFSGHAVAALLEKVKGLTHLDISGNSLGPQGGELITDQIELLYGIYPREFLKIVLFEIEEKKYTGRNAKVRKKLFTNLCSLNMSRNNIGPRVISGMAFILKNPNCGIFQLDISLNPVGLSSAAIAGNAAEGAIDLRKALMESKSLVEFHMRKTAYLPTELVTIFGGMAHQEYIRKLTLSDTPLDEPACLQLGNILEHSNALTYLDVSNCRMGANGGLIVAQKINKRSSQLKYLNVRNNSMGPIAAVYLAEGMQNENCTYHTLILAGNDFLEEGGIYVAKALINNKSATYIDLSSNQLSSQVGEILSDAVRGQFKNGIKVRDSPIKVLLLNDNPMIGYKSARLLVKGLSTHHVEHIELRNIGAGSRTAEMISSALRDPSVGWRYLDVSENNISRIGMNQIFWAIRNNRRCRVLSVSSNPVGSIFCSNEDALLTHGISVPVMLKENVVLRELNLSFLALTSEAGINIFDAIIDNHTIKKLSLRGNLFDDNVALMLPDLLKCNNVIEEIDFGHNRMGFACAYAIAESLEVNRSLKRLFLEYNNFGGAGNATLDSFARSLMMNYSLQVLFLDGNKLGPEWGIRLGEAIVRNNTLVQFSLRDNRLDSRAGESLLNAFSNAPYLLELAVTADEIGYQLYDQFRRIFNLKRASLHPDMLLGETIISPKQSAILSTYQGASHA
jgi:Ran GTPase-activating protein (RanGAP) involved in mRNA processing and transport